MCHSQMIVLVALNAVSVKQPVHKPNYYKGYEGAAMATMSEQNVTRSEGRQEMNRVSYVR